MALDSAFALAKSAYNAKSHANAKDSLQQHFPQFSFDHITELYLRACTLADACYDLALQIIEQSSTEDQVLADAKKRFPGFSDKTYKDALSFGVLRAK